MLETPIWSPVCSDAKRSGEFITKNFNKIVAVGFNGGLVEYISTVKEVKIPRMRDRKVEPIGFRKNYNLLSIPFELVQVNPFKLSVC